MPRKNLSAGPSFIEPEKRVTVFIAARVLNVSSEEVRRRIKVGQYRTLREGTRIYLDIDEIIDHDEGLAAKTFTAFDAGQTPVDFIRTTNAAPRVVEALWRVYKNLSNDEHAKKMKAKSAAVEAVIAGPCATCGRDERRRRVDHAYFSSTPDDPSSPCPSCTALRRSDSAGTPSSR